MERIDDPIPLELHAGNTMRSFDRRRDPTRDRESAYAQPQAAAYSVVRPLRVS